MNYDDEIDADDDVRTEIALLKYEVRAMARSHARVAGAFWGLVLVGAAALLVIGAYRERVDQIGVRVTNLESAYVANNRRNEP